tara:strand:+ start:840 stop:1322 length:483 start_codon:yes stop_codon:yes gene_type:complete
MPEVMQRYTISGFTIPQVTILAGALLATLGLSFYGFTDYLTALFPTLFGIILMIAGAVSVARPELNALSMHFAVLASLVSATLGLTTALFGTWTTTTSLIEQMLMSAIASAHLYACVASYYYGKAKAPGDAQTCGVNDLAVASKVRNPGPASVVAISLES